MRSEVCRRRSTLGRAGAVEVELLITMGNSDLVRKLMNLAGGDIDLAQLAIQTATKGRQSADLEEIVDFIVRLD
jgi:hypothetical protein